MRSRTPALKPLDWIILVGTESQSPHITDDKTEAQRGKQLFPVPMACWRQARLKPKGSPRSKHFCFDIQCPDTCELPAGKWHGGSQGEAKDSVLNLYCPKGWGRALAFGWLGLGRKAKRNVTLVLQILLCSQKINLVYGAPLSNSSSSNDG